MGDIKRGANTVQEFLTFQSLFSNMVLGQLDLEPSQHSRQSELNERDSSIPGDTPPPCRGALSGPQYKAHSPGAAKHWNSLNWAETAMTPVC